MSDPTDSAIKRIAFLIWDGPLHDTLVADRRYKWDKVLAAARSILTNQEKQ